MGKATTIVLTPEERYTLMRWVRASTTERRYVARARYILAAAEGAATLAIAHRFGLPPEVQHIIGTHSKEGDLGYRTVESIIVHHADFVSFEPFKE